MSSLSRLGLILVLKDSFQVQLTLDEVPIFEFIQICVQVY